MYQCHLYQCAIAKKKILEITITRIKFCNDSVEEILNDRSESY